MPTFGLTPQGFRRPRQSEILEALETAFRDQFGATVNVSPQTVFGQLIGIYSEREALIWEALEDDVLSGTPAGAEGVYVDNMLSLTGLSRLPAQATVTNPTPATQADGVTAYGLCLFGEPGTVIPAGSLITTSTQPVRTFSLDASVTLRPAVNAVQNLFFTATPSAGSYQLALTAPSGGTVTTDAISFDALPAQPQLVAPQGSPTTGTYTLALGDKVTDAIAAAASAADVQAALRKLEGYAGVSVQGAWATRMVLTFAQSVPRVTVTASTDKPLACIQAVAGLIGALKDTDTGLLPFTDVSVSAPAAGQLQLVFGARPPKDGQPSSGAKAQPTVRVPQNTLLAGQTAVNVAISVAVTGQPSMGVGTATCTETGAYVVPAHTLNVIGSSLLGWTGVDNQLDALTGRAIESDTEAMARRQSQLNQVGAGPLAATISRLKELDGVTAALGFQNTTAAAQQRLVFLNTPSSGSYVLNFDGEQTPALPFSATAAQLQKALNALTGLGSVTVTGAYAYGFLVDFNGAQGGQALPKLRVTQDTTGGRLMVVYGRPPKSVEYVVQGGDDDAIAQVILKASAGGIATYGAPLLTTLGSTTLGSQQVSVASASNVMVGEGISGQGLAFGATVTGIDGTLLTLSLPALATVANVPLTITHTRNLKDVGGNPQQISWSRPTLVPIYVKLTLTTDRFNVPGDPTSGANPDSLFDVASLQTIQRLLIDEGNSVGIAGLLSARGTQGLGSSFRDIPGIVDFDLRFDVTPNPTNAGNIKLLPDQAPLFASAYNTVSYA